MEATYKFLNYRYEKEPEHCRVPCEVIKETKQSYYIKLLAPNVRGRQYGDCIWVRKDSVSSRTAISRPSATPSEN